MNLMPRPVLKYQGGKYRIAPWILSFFPPHKIYHEPFGGAASVLMNKPRVDAEIYNDLDGNIVNVFRVLQDRYKAKELEYRLRYTPYARSEFILAFKEREGKDDIETARRTIIRSFMSLSADGATRKGMSGFGLKFKGTSKVSEATAWPNYPDCIKLFTERLKGVALENKDALTLIPQLDTQDTLHYVDPPYMPGTWHRGSYQHLAEYEYHQTLIEQLKKCEGYVVLSGYDNELYRDELYDWEVYTKETINQINDTRIECVWTNNQCKKGLMSKRLALL